MTLDTDRAVDAADSHLRSRSLASGRCLGSRVGPPSSGHWTSHPSFKGYALFFDSFAVFGAVAFC
jgi:hypothetical protein